MPVTDFAIQEKYEYLSGFGSYHSYVCSLSTSSTVSART